MASSMSSGERRGLSARRGGMTVLGKVAVPKPINLPSQRLENHGLDPNVEIVPKGTLSWGSCSSSSPPNAWGSSTSLLHSSDGVAGSPSRLSGRPSSGGSGTRPSTAGSDRSYEPTPSAWGPSSRPSSSSGALASNQTLVVTARPRSAETRPGSSQLSRFAELSENSVAWGASGTAEKLGVTSAKVNNFTLSSGDFPTLGSDKVSEPSGRQGYSSQGRPVSASGRVSSKESSGTSSADCEHVDANAEGETVNIWTGDKASSVGDGLPPSMEKWHRDAQQFPNTSRPPQHTEPWHVTPSDGVWYRGPPDGPPYGTPGPPGGPPYGAPGPPGGLPYQTPGPPGGPPCGIPGHPGGYPREQFNYYHAQGPPRPLLNSQPIPRPASGPSSYHPPNNADSYHPQIPESYLHPMMPIRPGIYPSMAPYDGYYGPPQMPLCNSSDRDAPVSGVAAGPCAYNRYTNQSIHHDSGNSQSRSAAYGSASTNTVKEQPQHSHDTQQGPYKVLLKQQDGWEEIDGEQKRGHAMSTNTHLEGGQQPRISGDNDSVTDCRKDKAMDLTKKAFVGKAFPQLTDNHEGSSVPGSMNNAKIVNDSTVKKAEPAATTRGPKQSTAAKRNPSQIDKIEGLNTRAQISDGRHDGGSVSSIDEKMKRSRFVNANVDHSLNESGTPPCDYAEPDTYIRDKTHEQKTSNDTAIVLPVNESQASAGIVLNAPVGGQKNHGQFHKRFQVVEVRDDNQVKGRFPQDGETWRKKPLVTKSSTDIPGASMETDLNVQDFHASQEAFEKSDSTIDGMTKGEYGAPSFEPNNFNAQHAKMKERAIQCAKQLQVEEEEQIREQKAKALAKLEELNRRTQAESSSRKLDDSLPTSGSILQKQEHRRSHVNTSSSRSAQDTADGGHSIVAPQDTNRLGESGNLSKQLRLEDSMGLPNLSMPLQQDVTNADAVNPKPAPPAQVQDSSSRQRPVGHSRKLLPSDKGSSERPTPIEGNGASRSHADVVPDAKPPSGEPGKPNNASSVDDPLPPQKRKTQKNGRSKHKLEEALSRDLPLSTSSEENPVKVHVQSAKAKATEVVVEVSSVHVMTSREYVEIQDCQSVPSADQGWSLSTEVGNSRANNQWRPQPRRMPRNQQATRSADKFHGGEAVVWAPVKSQNRNEESGGGSCCITPMANASFTKNGEGTGSNMTKGKRVEMERYVPKPVAKEMLQQGNIDEHPSPPKTKQSICGEAPQLQFGSQSTEGIGLDDLAAGKPGTVLDPKNVGTRLNKHGKAQGSWRQRGFTEPSPMHGLQEVSSLSLGTGKNAYIPIEPLQPQKPETYAPKGPENYSDDCTFNNPVSNASVANDVKDNSSTGRGKRHPFKGRKGNGHNIIGQKDVHGADKVDAQTSAIELNRSEGRVALRENYVGERLTPHWQPKSQTHVAQNQQGSSGNGSQKAMANVSRNSEKKFTQHADGCTSLNKDHGPPDQPQPQRQPHPHQSVMSKTNIREGPTARNREAKKEKKDVNSFKDCSAPPNQDPVNNSEISGANADTEHEQRSSSGLCRDVHHNGRFIRVQESFNAEHNPAGQDSSKQNHVSGNGDRKRHNSHYEYQPVGSHSNRSEDSSEGSGVMGSRYRERGQNHSRRGGGNFYARGNSSIRVAASYGNGE